MLSMLVDKITTLSSKATLNRMKQICCFLLLESMSESGLPTEGINNNYPLYDDALPLIPLFSTPAPH